MKAYAVVTSHVPPPPPPPPVLKTVTVTLELSLAEAVALRNLFGNSTIASRARAAFTMMSGYGPPSDAERDAFALLGSQMYRALEQERVHLL